MEKIDDQDFVVRLGDAGRYLMLSEIRRTSLSVRPDPVALMEKDLLASTDGNRFRVREERREIVRRLIEQAEKVRDQESKDDF